MGTHRHMHFMSKISRLRFLIIVVLSFCYTITKSQITPLLNTNSNLISLSDASVQIEGSVIDTGYSYIMSRGFVYKVYDNTMPDYNDFRVSDTGGYYAPGSYIKNISGLSSETHYSIAAYAINATNIGYGNRVDFYTYSTEPSSNPGTFTVSGSSVNQITLNFSAASTITNADGYLIVQGQNALPTFVPEDGKSYYTGYTTGIETVVAIVNSTSSTIANITGLTSGTTYYYKIYPYNFNGSNSQTFNYLTSGTKSTNAQTIVKPTLTTNPTLINWADTFAIVEGAITDVGGQNPSKFGIVYKDYSIAGLPTTANSKVDTSGSFSNGSLSQRLYGLTPAKHYKARSFAENNAGIGYGNQIDFFTYDAEPTSHINFRNIFAVNNNQIDISFDSAGSIGADGLIILMRQNVNPQGTPEDGKAYTSGASIGDASVAAVLTNTDNYVSVTNLTAGKTYIFSIYPFNWDGNNYQTYNYKIDGTIPTDTAKTVVKPTVLTDQVSNATVNSVDLSMSITNTGGENATAGAVYMLYSKPNDPRIENGDDTVHLMTNMGISSKTFSIQGLNSGEHYKLAAFATNSGGNAYGATKDFFTLSNEPDSISGGFVATTISTSQIQLDYPAASTNANGYLILQRQNALPTSVPEDAKVYSIGNSIGNGVVVAIVTDTALTSSFITSVSAGNNYYYKIFPYNFDGSNSETYNYRTDAWTNSANALTVVLPTVTTNSTIDNVKDTSVTGYGNITNSGGALITSRGIAYSVLTDPDINDSIALSNGTPPFGPGSFNALIHKLDPETKYYYKAYATNAAGTEYGSEYNFYTLSVEPANQPDTFDVVANSTTQIDLTFQRASTISNADGYLILQKQGSNTSAVPTDGKSYYIGAPVNDATVAAIISNPNQTTASITSVSAGNDYYFRLIPFNWNSNNSETYNYKTDGTILEGNAQTIIAPSLTINTNLLNVWSDSVKIEATVNNTGGGVITERGFCYDTSSNIIPDITKSLSFDPGTFGTGTYQKNVTSLLPAQKYYTRAYAKNNSGKVGYSSQTATFYTLAYEPQNHPANFKAITSSTSQIDLDFSAANTLTNAKGYLILQKQGSLPTGKPSDGKAYAIGSPVGDAIVATLVYSPSATKAYITSVSAGNTYYYKIFPFNWDSINSQTINYLITGNKSTSAVTIVKPTVTTSPNFSNIASDQGDLSGAITNTGSQNPTKRGICYQIFSPSTVPTIASMNVTDSIGPFGVGNFTYTIDNLNGETRYQYRAFAINNAGISYGNTYDFYTLSAEPGKSKSLAAKAASTTQVDLTFDKLSNDPVAKGYIIIQKQDAIPNGKPEDGVVYSVGTALGDGVVSAIFTDKYATTTSITSVSAGTDYYFTIYPFNWDGSNVETYNYNIDTVVFAMATTTTKPVLSTSASIQNLTSIGATINGNITNSGGATISERGFYYDIYSVANDPDTTSLKVNEVSGPYTTGAFSNSLSSLTPATRYEYRAYAKNTAGIGLGSTHDFFTLATEPSSYPALFDATAFTTTQIDLKFSKLSTINNVAGYLIVQSQGARLNQLPENATSYSVGNPIGNGVVTAIVSNITKEKISITNLNAGTKYYYTLIPFNWDKSNSETYHYRVQGMVPEDSATTINPCPIDATIAISGDPVICRGDSLLLQTVDTSQGLDYLWTFNGSVISGAIEGSYWAMEPGDYKVFLSNKTCSKASPTFTLTQYPIVLPKIYASGVIQPCSNDSLKLFTDNYSYYHWSAVSDEQFESSNKEIFVRNSDQYKVTVTDNYGCFVTSAPYTVNASINAAPEICMVTVDSLTNKNIIIWERENTTLIDSYYIYKETTKTGEFVKIGAVSYYVLSVFVDVNSNPAVKADRYKISALDTCGVESPLSPHHKTMHLTVNKGIGKEINLIWDKYEGFPFSTYKIYRGKKPDEMELIDSIQNNLTSYSDLNPPGGVKYYQVSVVNPDTCYPAILRAQTSSGPFSQSYSNLKDYSSTSLAYMQISPTQQIITKEKGGLAEFDVFTNLPSWTVSSDVTWLEVYTSLVDKKVFVKTLSANDDDAPRVGTVRVLGQDVEDQVLTIIQEGKISDIRENNEGEYLLKVYPNPFKDYTNIYYELANDAHVNVEVYDLMGKKIHVMIDENQSKGPNNLRFYPSKVDHSKGIYFLKFTVDNQTSIIKMIEIQ